MTADLPAPAERPGRWWSVLRAALLVMWLVAVAAIWWSAPRQATYHEAKAAVAEKRLTVYQWGDSWDSDEAGPWFDGLTLLSTGTRGPIFAWRTGAGQVRWADTADFGEVHLTGVVDVDGYTGIGAAGMAQELTAGRTAGQGWCRRSPISVDHRHRRRPCPRLPRSRGRRAGPRARRPGVAGPWMGRSGDRCSCLVPGQCRGHRAERSAR